MAARISSENAVVQPPIPTADEVGEVEWVPEGTLDEVVQHIQRQAEAQVPIEPVPQLADMPQCKCRWFRAWQLPCSHIWLHHFSFGSLLPAHFAQLFAVWLENGFEIYEEIRRPFVEALDNIIGVPRKTVLQFNEVFEQIRFKQFEIADFVRANNGTLEDLEQVLGGLLQRISGDLSWIPGLDIAQFVQQNQLIYNQFDE
jgi:hypothetical protein